MAVFHFLFSLYNEWQKDKISWLSAALAYFTLFTFVPLFYLTFTLLFMFLGSQEFTQIIVSELSTFDGIQATPLLQQLIKTLARAPFTFQTSFVGVIALFIAVIGFFGYLKDTFNSIWHVEPRKYAHIVHSLAVRTFYSLILTTAFVFIILFSLITSSVISYFSTFLSFILREQWLSTVITEAVISFSILSTAFSAMYWLLPDVELSWKDVIPGGLLASVLFTIGKYIIAWYLSFQSFSTYFGAASSVLALLIWIYYFAQIFYIGGEVVKLRYMSRKNITSLPS
ncbi:YihY/virulence factor BrkB family protein [Candidatus Roizmanbacteria bacterium]|nr:YihY/virulence factor BrkB family protein [Candidatus Roizmanbacteria bacterium]